MDAFSPSPIGSKSNTSSKNDAVNKSMMNDIVQDLERKLSSDDVSSTLPKLNVIIPNLHESDNKCDKLQLESPLLGYNSDGSHVVLSPIINGDLSVSSQATIQMAMDEELLDDEKNNVTDNHQIMNPDKAGNSINGDLLDENENVNVIDDQAIEINNEIGYNPCCESIFENKCITDTDDHIVMIANKEGKNPFCIASSRCFLEGMKLLLDHGADPTICDSRQYTPLHLVCEYSVEEEGYCHECVRYLFENGFVNNVNSQGSDGKTALHLAAERGDCVTIIILIHHGANSDMKDYNGNTALHLATIMGNFDCMRLLLSDLKEIKIGSIDSILSAPQFKSYLEKYQYHPIAGDNSSCDWVQKNKIDEEPYHDVTTSQYNQDLLPVVAEGLIFNDIHNNVEKASLQDNRIERNATHLDVWSTFFKNSLSDVPFNDNRIGGNGPSRSKKRRRKKTARHSAKLRESLTVLSDFDIMKIAILDGDTEKFIELINYGYNINEFDEEGNTVLHIAAMHGINSIISLILQMHTEEAHNLFHTKNYSQETALELARYYGNSLSSKLLDDFQKRSQSPSNFLTLSPDNQQLCNDNLDKTANNMKFTWGSFLGLLFNSPVQTEEDAEPPPPPPPLLVNSSRVKQDKSQILSP